MRVNGLMIRLMDSEGTCILMVLNTKATGKKTNSMVMEERFGLMVPPSRETTWMVESKVRELLLGLMKVPTLETLMRITYTVRESTNGPMVVSIKVLGLTTRCTGTVCSHGLMAADTKEST